MLGPESLPRCGHLAKPTNPEVSLVPDAPLEWGQCPGCSAPTSEESHDDPDRPLRLTPVPVLDCSPSHTPPVYKPRSDGSSGSEKPHKTVVTSFDFSRVGDGSIIPQNPVGWQWTEATDATREDDFSWFGLVRFGKRVSC